MELLQLLQRESQVRPRTTVALTVVSALATVVVIATISAAAQLAGKGEVSLRLATVFLIATALYALVQNHLMTGFAGEVEDVIHGIRRRLFAGIADSDLDTLRSCGEAPLFAALTEHTQTISRNLPLLVIGTQQFVLVVFICLYLAVLSLPAFAFASLFCVVIVQVHLARMKLLGRETDAANEDEGALFAMLDGLLAGLKQVRLSRLGQAELRGDLARISDTARHARTGLKARWGREFALIQLAFYILVGLMVFVVPLISDGFHEVAFAGTMAALFLIGPVGTVATAIPAIDEAERALQSIRRMREQLDTGGTDPTSAPPAAPGCAPDTEPAPAMGTDPFDQPLRSFALDEVRFAYPSRSGERGFSLGPVSARFEAGRISFLTGGNGSGKSTLMMLLTALRAPQHGRLCVNDQPLTPAQWPQWREQIATVFADHHLFSRLYGLTQQQLATAPEWLDRLELTGKVHMDGNRFSTRQLSSGQRRRLALIAAVLEGRPVLVLDEWAADQDPHFRRLFYESVLPQLRAQGRMLICVTHDERWFDVADQVLQMNEGRLESCAGDPPGGRTHGRA